MTRRPPPRPLPALGRVVLSVGLGLLAWPLLHEPFGAAFRAASNLVLENVAFGGDTPMRVEGHALLAPRRDEPNGIEDGPSYDSTLVLRLSGVNKTQAMVVNPRRLLYLPGLIVVGVVAAAPLGVRRQLRCIAIGFALVLLVALASLCAIATWAFAQVPGLVYDLSPWQQTVVELGYHGFASPVANRFIAAALLAAAVVGAALMREQPGTTIAGRARR